MTEPKHFCQICAKYHPEDMTCQSAKELAESMRTRHEPEPLRFNGSNPLVALAVAEGWEFPEGDPDMLAALHQTTGIQFMHGYILRAYDEGVLDGLPKPLDVMSPREVMRLYKLAWDRYGLIQTREDAPVPVNAGPRSSAPVVDLSQLTAEEREQFRAKVQQARSQPGNVVHMGKGEGEEFQMGDTTYKPEDAPACAIPASLLADRPVFVGTKRVMPFAMTRAQWCAFRGWDVPADENGDDAGFMVEYLDGGKPNHPGFKGYISWSPADVFTKAYKPEDAPDVAAAPQDGSKVAGYRKLSEDDIAQMNVFKSVSRSFAREIDTYKAHLEGVLNGPAMLSAEQAQQHRDALRWLAIARTDVQTACMAACRAVAQPENDC